MSRYYYIFNYNAEFNFTSNFDLSSMPFSFSIEISISIPIQFRHSIPTRALPTPSNGQPTRSNPIPIQSVRNQFRPSRFRFGATPHRWPAALRSEAARVRVLVLMRRAEAFWLPPKAMFVCGLCLCRAFTWTAHATDKLYNTLVWLPFERETTHEHSFSG